MISEVTFPQDFQPAYNQIEFIVSSTNSSQCDFVFIADVYVNGVFAVRLKEFPSVDDGYGHFKVNKVIKDYISYNFYPELTGYASNPDGIVYYSVEFRERYNSSSTCTGLTTLTPVLLNSGNRYAWNGVLTNTEFEAYDQDDYVINGATGAAKFLTNAPSQILIGEDSFYNLSFLQSNDGHSLDIKTYDKYDNLIHRYFMDSPSGSPGDFDEYYMSVGVGTRNLNYSTVKNSFAPFAVAQQPIIGPDVDYYTVQLVNHLVANVSELRTFKVDRRCNNFDLFRIHWHGLKGGFDSYSFGLKHDRTASISRQTITKPYKEGEVTGQKVTGVDANDSYVFRCDWMTESEGTWLKELFLSETITAFKVTGSLNILIDITGAVHNSSNLTADLVLDYGIVPVGATFSYQVDDGSPIGMATVGTGTITGYDSVTGYHHTDIVSTINAGALITGFMNVVFDDITRVNLVGVSPVYNHKNRPSVKSINIEFQAKDADNINTH